MTVAHRTNRRRLPLRRRGRRPGSRLCHLAYAQSGYDQQQAQCKTQSDFMFHGVSSLKFFTLDKGHPLSLTPLS